MKKFTLIITLLTLFSCSSKCPKHILQHKVGDMVYIKPDSVRVYIYDATNTHYWGSYHTEFGEKIVVFNDKQIY